MQDGLHSVGDCMGDVPPRSETGDGSTDLEAAIQQLRRENQMLRRRIRALEAYEDLAHRDALTGAFNRRYFDTRSSAELGRANRANRSVSVLIIDLDDFKQANDSAGHLFGDAMLQWVADFLAANVRASDVCCRIGGDEFALLLPETDAKQARNLVERLMTSLHEAEDRPTLPSGASLNFSVGTATFPEDGVGTKELFAKADAQMYREKRAHKTGDLFLVKAS